MGSAAIPVVDLGSVVGSVPEESHIERVAQQLHDSFSSIGFVYVINHGIDQQQVADFFETTDRFFKLDTALKKRYLRGCEDVFGYTALEMERADETKPGDLKEAFDITLFDSQDHVYPEEVPSFQKVVTAFGQECHELSQLVLRLMAVGLKLEDREYFSNQHSTSYNTTTLIRSLYYPIYEDSTKIKEGQLGCGEHTDYGSITLLFQDGVPGLEVMNRQGEYQEATPMPGAVLINIGDLMQRWTADKLVSTKHRVRVIGQDDGGASMRTVRRSIAFFAIPDDDCIIECIDGSNKYPPVKSLDYLNERYHATY